MIKIIFFALGFILLSISCEQKKNPEPEKTITELKASFKKHYSEKQFVYADNILRLIEERAPESNFAVSAREALNKRLESTSKNRRSEILPPTNFRSKFAGNYEIEVKGVSSDQSVEVYLLEEDGNASWLWLYHNGKGGAIVDDKKNGTWTASKSDLSISIRGNSGMIVESYEIRNGVLTNTLLPKRHLKTTSFTEKNKKYPGY